MKMRYHALVAACATLMLGGGAASAEPVSIEDYSQIPAVARVSMSLEGDMMVGLVADPSKDGKEWAAAYWDLSGDIDSSKPLLPSNITPSGKRTNFYAASALKNKKSLWFTTQAYTGALEGCGEGKTTGATKKYLQKVYMGNARIRKIDDLPDGRSEIGASKMMLRCFELVGQTQLASILPLEKEDVIISRATDKDGLKYFRHNLKTGSEKFLYKGSETESFVISDRDGMPVLREELKYEDGDWRFYRKLDPDNTGDFAIEDELTTTLRSRYTMDVLARQEESGEYFVATDKFTDKAAIYLYNAKTNSFSDQPVFAHPDFEATGVVTSQRAEDFGKVLGFRYAGPVSTTYWIDAEMQSIQSGLDASFAGHNVSLIDYTSDRNRVLFSVSSATRPAQYYLLLDKSRVAVIGGQRPWIDEASLGKNEFVYYPARDGLKIPAFVTYPPGFEDGQKARGAIIHPHGGPWARDNANFDDSGWTQYFASRGYIILQPQYRGSQGFGRELWLSGDAEWGQKMQDDKDDAAKWLVQKGLVDADKIAIHGYSYGGFAAIAASVRPNSPYQCAIAGAGVSNLAKLGNEWGGNRIQRIVQGDTVKGMDPMENTDKVNIPILLYHGDYDVRVPLFHSTEFYNAIKNKQPDSELIVLEKMGHQSNKWLPEHKARVLSEMERFLQTTCGM